MDRVNLVAKEQNLSLWNVISASKEFGFSGAVANKLSQFVVMIKSFGTQVEAKDAYELTLEIAKASGVMKTNWLNKVIKHKDESGFVQDKSFFEKLKQETELAIK